jgi:hypothetical protein
VVECGGLENRFPGNRNQGSNPCSSASRLGRTTVKYKTDEPKNTFLTKLYSSIYRYLASIHANC